MSTSAAKKEQLRSELRALRRSFVGSERCRQEEMIGQQIEVLLSRYTQGRIGIYLPFDGEVDISFLWEGELPVITPMNQDSLSSRFVFPVHKKNSELRFVEPQTWDDSQVLPVANGPTIPLSDLRVMLVPGVAFCPNSGLRLGLGGGHYDRTLSLCKEKTWRLDAFGVGFSFQQRTDIPREPWDTPLDGLISESGIRIFT